MLKTNKDRLVRMAVMGEVVHPFAARGYRTDFDGNPRVGLGMSGIKYNVSVGDLCYGYAEGEHIEPGLSISNKEAAERAALGVLGCIGNEVTAVTGEAKGAQGRITGKHGNFMVWFDREDQERINIGDKMRVKAWGVGLKIEGFDDVRVNKLDPELLEKMGMTIGEVDLFELNEAFAAVLASAFHYLPELPQDRTNLWGSGISLGHPVGCTGARQVVDMTHQLRRRGKKIGLTSRCVGGGMGSGEILIA